MIYKIKAKVWIYQGLSGWHFITLPNKKAKEIDTKFAPLKKSFSSIPVKVTVGNTSWKTSIFKDKKLDSYLLPIKLEIRKKENIKFDDEIRANIEIIP